MRIYIISVVLLIHLFCIVPNLLADLSDAPVISQSGQWSVRQVKDFMTDETSCVALYKDRFDIQVNEGQFYLSMRGKGGVDGFKYRFDEQDPKLVLPDKIMKEVGAVNLDGERFQQLLTAKRLRIQVITVLGGLVQEDIDLSGLVNVYPTLTGPKCK